MVLAQGQREESGSSGESRRRILREKLTDADHFPRRWRGDRHWSPIVRQLQTLVDGDLVRTCTDHRVNRELPQLTFLVDEHTVISAPERGLVHRGAGPRWEVG